MFKFLQKLDQFALFLFTFSGILPKVPSILLKFFKFAKKSVVGLAKM